MNRRLLVLGLFLHGAGAWAQAVPLEPPLPEPPPPAETGPAPDEAFVPWGEDEPPSAGEIEAARPSTVLRIREDNRVSLYASLTLRPGKFGFGAFLGFPLAVFLARLWLTPAFAVGLGVLTLYGSLIVLRCLLYT